MRSPPPAGMWFQRLSAGSHLLHVVLQRSDAATFLREHVLLKHAKLVRIDCHFDKVAVTIAPPADAPGTATGSKRRQNRRVDEVVENRQCAAGHAGWVRRATAVLTESARCQPSDSSWC